MKYFYGPVPSRRLGYSLGVDVIPRKVCTFDCIYCQLGRTRAKSVRRFSYVDLKELGQELKEILKGRPKIDYITFSGSGEPTLHKGLDEIVRAIKRVTKNKYPLCLITNSSLLNKKAVRRELKGFDLIIPSLDAALAPAFRKVNRPHKEVSLERIIKGLIALRKEFKKKIWLEVMLVADINDSISAIAALKQAIAKIRPDKVQLNIPVRPPAARISLPPLKKLKTIKQILGENVETVTFFSDKTKLRKSKAVLRYASR